MRRTLIAALVLAAAPLLAGPPAQQPPYTPGRPDLAVTVEIQKEQRLGKWFVRARFTVSNLGLASAPPSVLGFWCAAGAGVCPHVHVAPGQFAPPVDAGATSVVKLNTPPIPVNQSVAILSPDTEDWKTGRYTITARADFTTVVIESNEGNNQSSAAIVIP